MRDHIYSWTSLGSNLLQDKKKKILIYVMYVIPHISNRILDFFWELPKSMCSRFIRIKRGTIMARVYGKSSNLYEGYFKSFASLIHSLQKIDKWTPNKNLWCRKCVRRELFQKVEVRVPLLCLQHGLWVTVWLVRGHLTPKMNITFFYQKLDAEYFLFNNFFLKSSIF